MPKRVGCECDKATLSCVVGLKSMVKKNAFEFFNQCHFAVDVHGRLQTRARGSGRHTFACRSTTRSTCAGKTMITTIGGGELKDGGLTVPVDVSVTG